MLSKSLRLMIVDYVSASAYRYIPVLLTKFVPVATSNMHSPRWYRHNAHEIIAHSWYIIHHTHWRCSRVLIRSRILGLGPSSLLCVRVSSVRVSVIVIFVLPWELCPGNIVFWCTKGDNVRGIGLWVRGIMSYIPSLKCMGCLKVVRNQPLITYHCHINRLGLPQWEMRVLEPTEP